MPRTLEPVLGPVAGAVTGGITAATGVFVIPAVPYPQAIGLQKDELVQALGVALAGMRLGRGVRARMPPRAFRLCFFAGLLALGAYLALRGLGRATDGRSAVAAVPSSNRHRPGAFP